MSELEKLIQMLKAMAADANSASRDLLAVSQKMKGKAEIWAAVGFSDDGHTLYSEARTKVEEAGRGLGEIDEVVNRYIDHITTGGGRSASGTSSVPKPTAASTSGTLKGATYRMPGVMLRPINYSKRDRSVSKSLRNAFDSSVRRSFLKAIPMEQLVEHGFTDDQIAKIKDGKVPQGYQVHHKLPLDDGGTNAFDNLLLIKNCPDHQLQTNYQTIHTRHLEPGETAEGILWPEFPVGRQVWPAPGFEAHSVPDGPNDKEE